MNSEKLGVNSVFIPRFNMFFRAPIGVLDFAEPHFLT